MLTWYLIAAASLVGLVVTVSRDNASPKYLLGWCFALVVSVLVIIANFGAKTWDERGQVDHYSAPMTVEQARAAGCPIPLPPEAKNVRFGIVATPTQTSNLVRFEAPVEVCRAHMKEVIKTKEGRSPILAPLQGKPEPVESSLKNSTWFDISKIAHGETASFENILGRVWIDADRGVFYFHQER